MSSILDALLYVGDWILGKLIDATVIIAKLVISFFAAHPLVMIITIVIAALTLAVIGTITGMFDSIQEKHKNIHMLKTKEQLENQLNEIERKGEGAVLEPRIWHFTPEVDRKVKAVLDSRNYSEQEKNLQHIFVSRCFTFASQAMDGTGRINDVENFDIGNNQKATANFIYDTIHKVIKIVFSFSGEKESFFSYIKTFLTVLRRNGHPLNIRHYEQEFSRIEEDEDGLTKYVLSIDC